MIRESKNRISRITFEAKDSPVAWGIFVSEEMFSLLTENEDLIVIIDFNNLEAVDYSAAAGIIVAKKICNSENKVIQLVNINGKSGLGEAIATNPYKTILKDLIK